MGGFVSYTANGFDKNDQRRLRDTCDELTERGCKVLLSNSDTPFIRELYGDHYAVQEVRANRNINSDATGRGKVMELLIRNYAV